MIGESMKSRTTLGFTLFVAGAILLNACGAKDRNASFQQGQGENLEKISDYDEKTFEIQTLEEIAPEANTKAEIRSKEIKISLDQKTTQSFPLVNYKTSAKLLAQVPLHGRPNFKYQALYRVTENFLKVYQVGAKADIDKDQHTYAETLPDGRLAVPLIGYSVKGFFDVSKIKNSDNEDTNKLGEFSKEKNQAKQFRFDINSGQLFEAATKENNLRADYFTGDWYFAATVIAASEHRKDDLGVKLAYDQDLESANRIRFSLNENLLKAQNINIDDRLDKKDDINLSTALAIPIKWKDYETVPKGRDKELREREVTNKIWNQKRYVELDFDQTQAYTGDSKADTFVQGAKLTGLEVSDNSLSYTLELHKEKIRIRYSFLRVSKSDYQSKRYFHEDSKLFGFFSTRKALIINYEIQNRDHLEKNTFISRFNPSRKQIVYHFTKSSPEWVRPAARKAILSWDRAFTQAGTPTRIVLDESFDVDLGDLRYNTINLIESRSNQINLVGYGPSISDSLTGEIISASSNVHISQIRGILVQEIRNFVRSELGRISANYSMGLSQIAADFENVHTTLNSETQSLKMNGNFSPLAMKFPDEMTSFRDIEFKNSSRHGGREKDLSISSGNIHQEIKNQCPEVLTYINTLKNQKANYNDDEIDVYQSCSAKISLPIVQETLTHELGHNFGLRHNFMGSMDEANYWSPTVTETTLPIRSSSVMDYFFVNESRLTLPGAYDLAAIRYGYADAVLLNDNKTVFKLNPNQSIERNLGSAQMRPFKFCTDEDVMIGGHPLCFKFDAGTNPVEIVNNLIQNYYTSMALSSYRFDRYKANQPLAMALYRLNLYLLPMKRIYEEWRTLLRKSTAADQKYLEGFDQESYEALLNKLDPENKRDLKKAVDLKKPLMSNLIQYKRAANLIYHFLKTIAMLPNSYCITKDANGSMGLLELDSVRQSLFLKSNISAESCQNPDLNHFISQLPYEKSILSQAGYFLNDVRFDLNPTKATEPLDVNGSLFDRVIAAWMLSSREVQSEAARQLNFQPGMLDEPDYRADWTGTLESRVLEGVDTQSLNALLKAKIPDLKTALPQRIELYGSEKKLLLSQFGTLLKGLAVPGNSIETFHRKSRYASIITSLPKVYEKGTVSDFTNGDYFVAVNEQASFAASLANEYNRIQNFKTIAGLRVEDFKILLDYIKNNIPGKAQMDNLTVGQFVHLMAKMEILQFPATISDKARLIYNAIITNESAIQRSLNAQFLTIQAEVTVPDIDGAILEKDKMNGATRALYEEKMKSINSQKLKAFFEAEKIPYEFSKEHLIGRIEDLFASSKIQNETSPPETIEKLDTIKKVMGLIAN